jgi:cytochrome c556
MRIRLLGAALVALAVAGVAEASIDVATIVRTRQANFKTLLSLHRAIKGELTRGAPRMAVVSQAAAQEAVLARQLPSWFVAGAGPDNGVRTDARREVWSSAADFRAKAGALSSALARLETTARAGGVGRMRAQQRAVGEACQACHDDYLSRF